MSRLFRGVCKFKHLEVIGDVFTIPDGTLTYRGSYQNTTTPVFRVGQTGYPAQVKVHNRPATTGNSIEVRARPWSATAEHFAVDAMAEWRPTTTNYGSTKAPATAGGLRAVQGVAHLGSGYSMTGGGLTGVYGQVRNDGTVNGNIFMAALYGLIEDGGTYTQVNHVCSLWLDSHLAKTVSSGKKSFVYITNNGLIKFDTVFHIYGGTAAQGIATLFKLDTCTGTQGFVGDNVSKSGKAVSTDDYRTIAIDVDGETYYLLASKGWTVAS